MNSPLVFLALIATAIASVSVYPMKVGDKLDLNLGSNIKTWQRNRNGVTEYIKQCAANDNSAHCSKFDGKVGSPVTAAKVLSNGHLVIEKVAKHDAGSYNSPEQANPVAVQANGSVSMVAAPVIRVTVN